MTIFMVDRKGKHFWKEGRDFLIGELNRLKGDSSPDVSKLLVDSYGIDIYHKVTSGYWWRD